MKEAQQAQQAKRREDVFPDPDHVENVKRVQYIIEQSTRDGKISRRLLTHYIVHELSNAVCLQCDIEIKAAKNLRISNDPRIDDTKHTVCSIYLAPTCWRIFRHLYLHGFITKQIVKKEGHIPYSTDFTHSTRNYICQIRRVLKNTGFNIITFRNGHDTAYRLEIT